MGYRVAVVGATGAVGGEMLNILAERKFPVDEVVALASKGSAGKEVSFGENEILTVRSLEDFEFEGCDLGLFSPGAAVSK
ncbi:MAG: aspartate-semialdehyde dehydrogenase, partial [Geminicoccaceae bacterium]